MVMWGRKLLASTAMAQAYLVRSEMLTKQKHLEKN